MRSRSASPSSRPALRIGVTGHRREGLQEADTGRLRDRVREVLQLVRRNAAEVQGHTTGLPAANAPLVQVISPLAEGTDRVVAAEALDLGFELCCPLPFERGEYERDFPTDESREEFRTLLGRASIVRELAGSRDHPERELEAYEAVGRAVLRECDVLLAVWNGEAPRGRGGTGQIVDEAAQLRIPVVWIHSRPPHQVQLRLPDGARTDLGALAAHLP